MDNITFCKKLREIAEDYNTVYMKGVFGAPVNEHTVSSKSAQYKNWYTEAKQEAFKKRLLLLVLFMPELLLHSFFF